MSTDRIHRSLLQQYKQVNVWAVRGPKKRQKRPRIVEMQPLSEVRLHSFEVKKETNKQNKTKIRPQQEKYAGESYKTKKTILQLWA